MLPMQYASRRAGFSMKNTGGRMAAAKKSEISDRGAYTRTEKQLLALLGLIVCMIVFLTLRR
jgi:hypothetical protein